MIDLVKILFMLVWGPVVGVLFGTYIIVWLLPYTVIKRYIQRRYPPRIETTDTTATTEAGKPTDAKEKPSVNNDWSSA